MIEAHDIQAKAEEAHGPFGTGVQQAPVDQGGSGAVQQSEGDAPPQEASAGAASAEAVAPIMSHWADDVGVQQKGGNGRAEDVHRAAALGVQESGGSLPFLDQIQRSFGRHDVSNVQAHVGGAAEVANKQMGAEAYAAGNHVAFKGSPDLHTAAHEAAHVVQQRGGVQLKDGVGAVGDKYERNADAVADRVVQGQSAEDLLEPVAGRGQESGVVQQRQLPKKQVSGKAMKRIVDARKAIAHTKEVMAFGAGNQAEALRATNFNSYFRLRCMRDPSCWEMTPQARALAATDPAALTAAKADLAQGGNCGEHAIVAFDYLRALATGDPIAVSAKKGLDHAFVLIGDLSEGDEDIVVSDPWPTMATATTWGDHFAFTGDRSQIERSYTGVSDGNSKKDAIKAGLRLSARGQQMIKATLSDEETEKEIEENLGGWIWQHEDAAAKKYDYYSAESSGGGSTSGRPRRRRRGR